MSIDPTSSDPLPIRPGMALPRSAMRFEFVRSSGPGGQHVNKTSTQAVLIVDLEQVRVVIGDAACNRLVTRVTPSRVSKYGDLRITDSSSRSQLDNREACLVRLQALLRAALVVPKTRKRTRPSRASIQRRIDTKKQRARIKRARRSPGSHGDEND